MKGTGELTAGLNYEAEYNRACEELKKMHDENCYLREELKQKDREMHWHHGFKAAVELIFGKGGFNA